MTKCHYFPRCTGCNHWDIPYTQQRSDKIHYLQSLLKNYKIPYTGTPDFISCGEAGLRHRVDFTLEFKHELNTHVFGFYDQNKNIIQIDQCLQLDPNLQKIYAEFIKFQFYYNKLPIGKGSVRLRIGPNGIKGCWLDFSNKEIKSLLDDGKLLNELLDAGFIVEIGQKSKQLSRSFAGLKLGPPNSNIWFKTRDNNNNSLDLKCAISDFTQPSWTSAEVLVQQVKNWLTEKNIKSVLEFGSGIGQFTLNFLSAGLSVDSCEINQTACEQLRENAENHHLNSKLSVHCGDFHNKRLHLEKKTDLTFVNPARSGLKLFTDEILNNNSEYLIYVSCFPETMLSDLERLINFYSLCNISIVDQFPQTKHFETCTLLKKLH